MQFDNIKPKDYEKDRRESDFNPFKREEIRAHERSLPKTSQECPECKDTGIIKEKNGSIHTCWTCLEKGRLDVHSKNLPNNKEIKL